jgi:hypothetical protein
MDVLIVERDPMVAEVLADALADVGIIADITADDDQVIAGCRDSEARVVITWINRRDEDIKGMTFGRAMRDRMAEAVDELAQHGTPAFEAVIPVLSQLLEAETAEREVRSMAYQLKAARFPAYRNLAGFA